MRLFTTFCTIIAIVLNATAQKKEVYHDQFGMKGQVKYSGTLSDTALPKNGLYELQWREVDSNMIQTYFTKGNLKNHLPTGQWVWEQANWQQQINVGTSVAPIFQTTGKRAKWSGKFVNGLQDGTWIYVLDSISVNGQVKNKLLRVELSYKNGIPNGNFKLEEFETPSPIQVAGQTANGIAVGTWKYTYKKTNGSKYLEERLYSNGLLLSTKISDGSQKFIREFNDNQLYFKDKDKEKLPFQIGDLHFDMDDAQDAMSEWLRAQLNLRYNTGWRLANFPHEITFHTPMYKRLQYPLTDTEIEQKKYILKAVHDQLNQINGVMVDHMEIHRTRNATLDTTVTYLDLVTNRLKLIDSFMHQTNQNIFLYQTREISNFNSLFSKLKATSVGQAKIYDSLEVSLPKTNFSDSSATIFNVLNTLLQDQNMQLPRYIKVVEDAHLSVKQESELQLLEEDLLQRLALQQAFYGNKLGLKKEIGERWIEKEIPNKLQKYAQADVYEDAKKIGLETISLLDSLQSWQNQSIHLDKADSTIKATYTLFAYNPYTGANDISMVVKRRFLTTITSQLWPHLLAELDASKNWTEWSYNWNQTWNYYNYFLQFASMDDKGSKRVEKKVRKEKKVERMLKIIDNHMEDIQKSLN